jgi:hypothetical protein
MPRRRRPVFVETQTGRKRARFSVGAKETAVDVSLQLREVGLTAYKVRFDPELDAWIAVVIDWERAA